MNTLRLFWLKLAATVATLLAGGCMSPHVTDEDASDCIVDPTPDPISEQPGSAVSFSMDAEQFASFAKWLGHGNTLSIEKAVHVEQNNVTLDAKAGTRFSYAMAADSGAFTFEKPYPTVKAGIAKLIGGVSLHTVTINSDGSGVAATGLGRYGFRWLDPVSSAIAEERSEVWAYSSPGCAPCEKAKKELAEEADELPFVVIWRDDPPTWMESRPGFWWHTTGKQPSQADLGNTRQHQSWLSLKDFLGRWKLSREPKQYQRAGQPGKLPFNSSHNCPSCGRQQFDIENQSGPVSSSHTHRCGRCGTAWYHAD